MGWHNIPLGLNVTHHQAGQTRRSALVLLHPYLSAPQNFHRAGMTKDASGYKLLVPLAWCPCNTAANLEPHSN